MTSGAYDYVIHFSQCGASLKTMIWCGTSWSRGQHTTPHCTYDICTLSYAVF